uniref:helix-turn-helix domain-containing protein n=1 Tax=Variovorax sp. BK018 TaxID=3450241 RepID=UPI004039E440
MSFRNVGARDVDGELTSVQCGAIGVNRVASDPPMIVARDAGAIARSPKETWYLLCITDTPWSIRHHRLYSELQSGDLVLLDSREPYELRYPMAGQARSLELPVDWLKGWIADPTALAGRPLRADHGWSRVLSSFVDALTPEYVARAPQSDALLADQLGGLLTLTAADFEPPVRVNRVPANSLGSAVRRVIKEQYDTPGLTAAHVARRLGVSVRTIHRAMGLQGLSFSDALMCERMAAARRMIGDPAYDGLALGEIGRRVGLLDPSHFVRQYRRHFGGTPGSERRGR